MDYYWVEQSLGKTWDENMRRSREIELKVEAERKQREAAAPRPLTEWEADLLKHLADHPIPWGGYVPGLSDGPFAEARATLLRDGLAEYRGDRQLCLTAAGRRVAGL